MCKALHALPQAGGLLDQDSLFVYLAGVYEQATGERAELERANQQAAAK